MSPVTNRFMKLFRGSTGSPSRDNSAQAPQRPTRRSSGLAELARLLKSEEPLCVLDIGATSAANIRYLTERGHKIYSEDLLDASTDSSLITKNEQGERVLDHKKFLADNLLYSTAQFDIVFCWNLADYLDESLVKPVVGRLWTMTKPGGVLLAFFHTREAGPDAPCYRYHIVGHDVLEAQPIEARRDLRKGPTGAVHTAIQKSFRLQRVFNNRHIENLFRDFSSIKFFLTRDNVREVLVVR
ncbi:MAG TPA: methyltransferase domain-containing protein [Terriglobales bacterium]|nr:methyltransferase domain-containing protein [Terriglobales bacterium]